MSGETLSNASGIKSQETCVGRMAKGGGKDTARGELGEQAQPPHVHDLKIYCPEMQWECETLCFDMPFKPRTMPNE